MEAEGFEIRDVESWREHYALTSRLWHRRLLANKESAIAQVGAEKVRIWLLYLAGVSLALSDGALRIYQTVAVKHKAKGLSGLPQTRADCSVFQAIPPTRAPPPLLRNVSMARVAC